MNAHALDDERRVAVTGLGVISSIGDTVPRFWESLKSAENGIKKITLFDPKGYHTDFAGEVSIVDEHYDRFRTRKMARRLDRHIVFGYLAAKEALDDSGMEAQISAHPERYSALFGSGAGGVATYNYSGYTSVANSMEAVHPMSVLNAITSTNSGYFAQMHGLQGPNFSISSACSGSNYSLAVASQLIRSGLIDGAFAGGVEAPLCPLGVSSFGNLLALSRRKDDCKTASRPFDVDRDGFVLGEGGGVLFLERLDLAKKRGAHIYCEISGFGWSCDAYDMVAPRADGACTARAIQMALDQSGINASDIDLINAHATSTPLGDVAEWHAIQRAFGEYADRTPTHSTKSLIGHLLGGAGGAEAVAIMMAFQEGYAHQTINQFHQDPEIKLNVIKNEPLKINAKHILSNGFGFGGQNASVIFSRFES